MRTTAPDTTDYETALTALRDFLASVDSDPDWNSWTTTTAGWVSKLQEIHSRGDVPSELEIHAHRVLEAFGGMGSLNDPVITVDPRKNNPRLNALRDRLYAEARRLLDKLR